MGNSQVIHNTQEQILRAALGCFAEKGYAAASVQEIVSRARVSKPALYYYFADKANLWSALVQKAQEERYRLVREAAQRGHTVAEKLEEITAALFSFALRNRELVRLQLATAFGTRGQAPCGERCQTADKRNYELIRSLMEAGQQSGELSSDFTADELAMGIFGQLNIYVMVRLLVPECPLDRRAASRIVRLFLAGAGARKQPVNGKLYGAKNRRWRGKSQGA